MQILTFVPPLRVVTSVKFVEHCGNQWRGGRGGGAGGGTGPPSGVRRSFEGAPNARKLSSH